MLAIHTLNARGNMLLPLMREHFSFSDERTFVEIQRFHRDFLEILRSKGIDYASLRSALTPQPTKHEAAFLFDVELCVNSLVPGVECAETVFDALDMDTTHSILGGVVSGSDDGIARHLLDPTVVCRKTHDFRCPNSCFALYVNNLSKGAVERIDTELLKNSAYLGYLPCTYASLAKTFISMHLMNLGIKQGNTVTLRHRSLENDRWGR